MKLSLILVILLISSGSFASGISGKVLMMEGCAKKVMVWLSLDKAEKKERLLLMHTEVPIGGSFKFYSRPGKYQVRASDERGCESFQRIEVKEEEVQVIMRMVKK